MKVIIKWVQLVKQLLVSILYKSCFRGVKAHTHGHCQKVSCFLYPVRPHRTWNEATCLVSSPHVSFVPTETHQTKQASAKAAVVEIFFLLCPPCLFFGWHFLTNTVSRVPEPDTQGPLFYYLIHSIMRLASIHFSCISLFFPSPISLLLFVFAACFMNK